MLKPTADGFVHAFSAMASPCEVRVETHDQALAMELGRLSEAEARRIETKFSRYRDDNILARINTSAGQPVEVDAETAALLDYAAQCHALSSGLFDITSGVLRRIWKFDGSDRVPRQAQVDEILPLIGLDKVVWNRPVLTLPAGMEIDLGGLGKEYAVDSTLLKLTAASDAPILVNFGGDLRVSGPRLGGERWAVTLESVERAGASEGVIEIAGGALTTSGDAKSGVSLLRQASGDGSNDPRILYHFAVALHDTGDKDAAKKALETVVAHQAEFKEKADAQALLDKMTKGT